ncbi:MAG: hypothetical protein LLG01_12750 [Planctomycetaceae bacterium]|nr:hypothetical protein [Planctomycetaceae bacterium]
MARWVASPIAGLGAAGAYPTWLIGGAESLEAEGLAGAVVLSAMLVTGLATVFVLRASPTTAIMGVLALGMARMVACVLLGAVAYHHSRLPLWVLTGWIGGFYIVGLVGETAWLYRTMKRLWPAQAAHHGAVGQQE